MNFLKTHTLLLSSLFFHIMFVFIVFVISPLMDGAYGLGVIELQLSFDKALGIEIVKSWGASGVENFNKWIFADYIYAVAYALFLVVLLSHVKAKGSVKYIPLVAGFLDCLENSMEWVFINNQAGFSEVLFFAHSVVASIKFLLIIITFYIISKHWIDKNNLPSSS